MQWLIGLLVLAANSRPSRFPFQPPQPLSSCDRHIASDGLPDRLFRSLSSLWPSSLAFRPRRLAAPRHRCCSAFDLGISSSFDEYAESDG